MFLQHTSRLRPARKLVSGIALLALAFGLAGCATQKMAFGSDPAAVPADKPVYLMSVTLKNDFHPDAQPRMLWASFYKPGAKADSQDYLDLDIDEQGKRETGMPGKGNTYLLRMPLAPGVWEMSSLMAVGGPALMRGHFTVPINARIHAKGPGVFYLGHLDATVRKAERGEVPAGPGLPIAPQAASGAMHGTFDVSVSDAWASDEALFRNGFPKLGTAEVTKEVLPPIVKAQLR